MADILQQEHQQQQQQWDSDDDKHDGEADIFITARFQLRQSQSSLLQKQWHRTAALHGDCPADCEAHLGITFSHECWIWRTKYYKWIDAASLRAVSEHDCSQQLEQQLADQVGCFPRDNNNNNNNLTTTTSSTTTTTTTTSINLQKRKQQDKQKQQPSGLVLIVYHHFKRIK